MRLYAKFRGGNDHYRSIQKNEALELKERGLLIIALTIPLRRNDPALATWKNHLKSISAP